MRSERRQPPLPSVRSQRSARRLQSRFQKAVDQNEQNKPEKNPGRQTLQKRRCVLRDGGNERIGLVADDDVQQQTQHDQQECRLDGRPADRSQLPEKIRHWRAGWGLSPHPSSMANQATDRCEKSHMMMPKTISPTKPLLPSWLTSPMMLATTPPKNGRVPPTNNAATMASANSIIPISVRPPIHIL